MNISTYIFGSLGYGYSQYPNDYAQTIFQSIYTQSSTPTQIVVHREDRLIYYVYIRKLEKGQYIGLCVVLNSVMLTDFKDMFSIFENIITSLVVNGIILQFNDNGDIISKTSHLHTHQTEVSRITDNLRSEFVKLEKTSKALPPISYRIAKNEKSTFSINDNINDILKSAVSYNYTFIVKQKDFDTQSLNSYKGVLSRINKENVSLKKINQELQEKNKKILRQKKQYATVIFLIVIVIGCGIGLYLFYNEVNDNVNRISNLENTIKKRNSAISDRDSTILGLQNSLTDLKNNLNVITSYSVTTGATIRNNDSHDNGWIMWLHAKQKVQMHSFFIKGSSSSNGNVTIALYDSNDNMIASVDASVSSSEFKMIYLCSDWTLNNGYYYLRIKAPKGNSLQYHSSNDKEYGQFAGGALEVTGCCNYGDRSKIENRNNHNYYQYFYNIRYKIITE